ncbi:hypothetical protein LEP1GSC185_3484 [Leptospira licerasiae serovar Varillal str. VAR 010]|uniref:Uncharacterized protein n=1 Tax=Leptospira licerasiae str. MMD4847 TaxID=1049971 RepID=A0ABN0HCQ3_9LEPT|nr:hypothetical protein LEP1GSC185_3484 [Leptospira licerasiae serovar Varillal str. VAR 010]EJZ43285.1 hypothetical protein LEP1GSC178_3097 [Leptospira licerasiae str. MMD4847]
MGNLRWISREPSNYRKTGILSQKSLNTPGDFLGMADR